MKNLNCYKKNKLMPLNKAKEILLKGLVPLKKIEIVNVKVASDRILAENIKSKNDSPPYDNAAVDGYAFNYKDYMENNLMNLKIVGSSKPGSPFLGEIKTGECIKVYTGAAIINKINKMQKDTIVMEEDCTKKNNRVEIRENFSFGVNIRRKGEDINKGSLVLKKGIKIRSVDLGYIKSLGIQSLKVYKKPCVGVFSSGDELLSNSKKNNDFKIFDSNKYTLLSLLNKSGCNAIDLGLIFDNYDDAKKKLNLSVNKCDLIITTGGISSSETDKISKVVKEIGTLKFWKLAIKPGRPLAFGKINNIPFFGLPGNPVAVIVTYLMIIIEYINKFKGRRNYELPYNIIPSGFTIKKKIGRTEWLRGSVTKKNNNFKLIKFSKQGSGILSSIKETEGIIELDDFLSEVKVGFPLKFYKYEDIIC